MISLRIFSANAILHGRNLESALVTPSCFVMNALHRAMAAAAKFRNGTACPVSSASIFI
ncbi:hypothetical protein JQ633_00285 [Bradyrhizobium tropiciagri]|uniref:hypothetical protein n=1 Tax=Bradyrhizobium tropiciagri TaxID=312253 RepID=UPI001BA51A53|nr:hypothetical protein [Bradyrhizobium tropiciagri]MBR0868775.1 hypothetical protein [Bradyrhizobium tropiciagri]